jgi:hypothetical protein
MAKLAYSKLGIKSIKETENIIFNEQNIEIKKYLPINEKLKIVEKMLEYSSDDKRFYNVGKIEVYLTLEIIYNYTNIVFTDKQKEDPTKLYDNIVNSELMETIISMIPEKEIEFLKNLVDDSIKSIYQYTNSALGILDAITQDYSNLNLDASEIQAKLADPSNLELLKNVLTKLG